LLTFVDRNQTGQQTVMAKEQGMAFARAGQAAFPFLVHSHIPS
jgi:hypothetical protein